MEEPTRARAKYRIRDGWPSVEFSRKRPPSNLPPLMCSPKRPPIGGPLWEAVSSFVEEEEPGAKAAPTCVAGFTDSHWMRDAFGTVAYGFFPARAMDSALAARLIHSANERVPVADLELGVRFLRHAAQAICG